MIMEIWQIWCIAALLLFIVEIFTTGFGVLCIALGCVGSAIASTAGLGINGQIAAFCITGGVSFITIRPVLLKCFCKSVSTNTEALIGRPAIVTEEINNANNAGRIKVDGDSWKAISRDGTIIPVNEKVIIIQINSTVLTVKKSEV